MFFYSLVKIKFVHSKVPHGSSPIILRNIHDIRFPPHMNIRGSNQLKIVAGDMCERAAATCVEEITRSQPSLPNVSRIG
jgi:hypothetical protein